MSSRAKNAVGGPAEMPSAKGEFPTTRWSRVGAAEDSLAGGRDEALANLCRDYWPPIFSYLRRRGLALTDAEDMAQGFFAHLLEHRTLKRANARRGRFRSFLLGALKHYLANEAERAHRQKRGGNYEIISLDDPQRFVSEPACVAEADDVYERSWAHEVMRLALERLREKFGREGKADFFNALAGFLDGAKAGEALEQKAAALGLGAGALRTAVSRLRKQFAEQLRLEIARTVSAPHEIEEEFRHLRTVLLSGA